MIGCAVAPDALSLSLSRPAPKFQGYNLAHVPTSCSHGKNWFERYLLLQLRRRRRCYIQNENKERNRLRERHGIWEA